MLGCRVKLIVLTKMSLYSNITCTRFRLLVQQVSKLMVTSGLLQKLPFTDRMQFCLSICKHQCYAVI